MMQESPDPEDDQSPSQSDLSMLSQDLHALKRSGSNTSYEDREYRFGWGTFTRREWITDKALNVTVLTPPLVRQRCFFTLYCHLTVLSIP